MWTWWLFRVSGFWIHGYSNAKIGDTVWELLKKQTLRISVCDIYIVLKLLVLARASSARLKKDEAYHRRWKRWRALCLQRDRPERWSGRFAGCFRTNRICNTLGIKKLGLLHNKANFTEVVTGLKILMTWLLLVSNLLMGRRYCPKFELLMRQFREHLGGDGVFFFRPIKRGTSYPSIP
jgi:hypothetical protein